MSAPVKVLDRIEIDGRGVFTVRAVDAVEGGGFGLSLENDAGAVIFEEIHRHRDGVWRTEELEAVSAYSPAVGTDDAASIARKVQADLENACRARGIKLTPCHSCGAPMYWSESKNGKPVPTNPDGTSHWGTCPQAQEWRKKHGPKEDETAAPAAEPEPAREAQLDLFGSEDR